MRNKIFIWLILVIFRYSNGIGQHISPQSDSKVINIVLIMDGLRPDAVTHENMPNLFQLQNEGVKFTNSHAVIPTVTRVNSSSLASGYYSGSHGIMSNSIFFDKINSKGSISTGNYRVMQKMDSITNGNLLTVKSIGEILHQNNKKYVVLSSGSTGSAYLLNHHVNKGYGYIINPEFDNGNNPAIPYKIGVEINKQFEKPPVKNGDASYNTSVDWVENVLYKYVLPELKPDVIYNWFTEPDHSQHRFGTGSKEYYQAIKNNDKHVGLLLQTLKNLGLYENANIIVTSDHGMNDETQSINLEESLRSDDINPDDFVIASSGETILLYVKERDKEKIKKIVKNLQSKNWIGAIFTDVLSSKKDKEDFVNPYGSVEGTFSLDLIHANHPQRKPDILFNYRWTSKINKNGISGTSYRNTNDKPKNIENRGGHGNISPASINNTLIAWGKNFKSGIVINNPSGIVDITPTILELLNIESDNKFDGRVIKEALINGPDHQKVLTELKTYHVSTKNNKYQAAIQISKTGNFWYVDKAWRK